MMAFIRPRLRKPLGIALAGTVFTAAWALRAGHAWQLSLAMEVTRARWPVPAPTSGKNCSACGRGPWAGTSPWPLPSTA